MLLFRVGSWGFFVKCCCGTSDGETVLTQAHSCETQAVQRLEKDSPSGKDGLAVSACLVPAGPMVSWAAGGRLWPAG